MKTLSAFLVLAFATFTAQADLSKWVDETGVMHYSDTRPAGIQADSVRNVTGQDSKTSDSVSAPKSYVERAAEIKKARLEKQTAEEQLAQEKAFQEERQRNCASAQESLRALESGTRIVSYDANGEKIYLDDAAREQRLQNARAAVQTNCN
ncbi:MAG: hypothetical protein Fur0026_06410 [Sideroxydans sp.]